MSQFLLKRFITLLATLIGASVVVFAEGPIGLCATAGAKLCGASLVIGVLSGMREGSRTSCHRE